MVSLYTAKFGDHNSIVVVEMFLVVEGQDSTCPGLSMRPALALVQSGTLANQFASAIDFAGNITNFTENRAGKSFFFSEDSKETCPLIFVSAIRKVKP